MRVSIVQPQYLPWVGFWALMDAADVMVLLDTVPIARQSWQTRNRVRSRDGRLVWLSVPSRANLGVPLNQALIDNKQPWKRKHRETIKQAYGKTPGWERVNDVCGMYLDDRCPTTWLSPFTCGLVNWTRHLLGIATKGIWASGLEPTRTGKTERLEDLLGQLGASSYLTTRGATYLQGETHIGSVPIEWFDYEPQPYEQGGLPWQSHLSVVDLLAHSPDPLSVIRAGVQ